MLYFLFLLFFLFLLIVFIGLSLVGTVLGRLFGWGRRNGRAQGSRSSSSWSTVRDEEPHVADQPYESREPYGRHSSASSAQTADQIIIPASRRQKVFTADEGEYVDYQEESD